MWYDDAQHEGSYLWYETAFMTSPLLTSGVRNEDPFWLPPNGAAHEAIAPGITRYQVAWPFTPLVSGALDSWIGEWAQRLAEASQGAMQIPSHMPERDPAARGERPEPAGVPSPNTACPGRTRVLIHARPGEPQPVSAFVSSPSSV